MTLEFCIWKHQRALQAFFKCWQNKTPGSRSFTVFHILYPHSNSNNLFHSISACCLPSCNYCHK